MDNEDKETTLMASAKEERVEELVAGAIAQVTGSVEPLALVPEMTIAEAGVTSLQVFALATEIERRMGVPLADDEFRPENFRDVAALHAMVRRHCMVGDPAQDA